MTNFQFQLLRSLLTLMSVTFLVSCGSSQTASSGFGSIDSSSSLSPNTPMMDDKNNAVAICSQDVAGNSEFKVRLMQFVDPYNQPRNDYVRLQFKAAPAAWQSQNLDLLVYRWTASPDNAVSIDSTPLTFQFERRVPAGFQLLASQTYQIFNFQEMQQFGTATNVAASSAQEFFNTASLLVNLKDLTNSYQVLRVVLRSPSGPIVYQTDILIPTFLADPAKYNADSRHPVSLQVLHPLKDKLGQDWSQASYFEFARAFCF